MAKKRAKGGNVTPADAAARVEIAEKSALVTIGVPNAKAKPEVFKAETIDEAIDKLDVSFKVKMTKLDGSTAKERLEIRSLDDFEEEIMAQKSKVMNTQRIQMQFLHDFQNELRTNKALQEELTEILQSKNKDRFIRFLQEWIEQFKKPDPQILQLLFPSF